MRTKRFLATTAAMLVMLAIIGSGFSFWFFGTNVATATQTDTSKDVTQLVVIGDITPATNFKINFDQTANGRQNNGSNVDLGDNDTTDGIKVVFTNPASDTKTATFNGPNFAEGSDHSALDSVEYTFTVTITVTNALAEYLKVSSGDTTHWTCGTSAAGDTETTYTFTSTNNKVFDWTSDIKLEYADSKEPTDKSAYNTFKGIVESADNTISVSYKAELKTKA